ncbi:nitrogen regulation protein NR(II), partial [Pseudomonadota bacterium]
AQQSLEAARRYLQTVTDAIPSMLIGIDANMCVTHMNQIAGQSCSVCGERAKGRPLSEVFPILAGEEEFIRKGLEGKGSRPPVRISYLQDGERFFADLGVYPIRIDGENAAVVRVEDVTDRVRVELIMVQTEKMMSVGGLAAGLAHEINNPLGGILQATQNIRRRLTPGLACNVEDAQSAGVDLDNLQVYLGQRGIIGFMDAIADAGKRASDIVNNMLQFSRKASARGAVDLRQLMEQTVKLAAVDYDLKKNYDFRNINITQEYAPDLPSVCGSSGEIQQVLLNLLRNAAQALSKGGTEQPTVHIRAMSEDDCVRIEMEDNGPGMDAETSKRVFEPFFTTQPPGEGTGLGLSVSYFIVHDEHGGDISVESSPGKGAKFIVKLGTSCK